MGSYVNLIKLSVGTETVEGLAEWQAAQRDIHDRNYSIHVTRMWPKREAEVLQGGSIYWVIKGFIQARQKIIRFDERIGDDGIRRCGIVIEPELIRTTAAQKRPFQGWRYLAPTDAPKDLPSARAKEQALPEELELALADLGLK